MQIAVITGPTYKIAYERILLANRLRDGIELRLDLFQDLDLSMIQDLRNLSTGKVIFTLRSRRNGGGFLGSEEKRLKLATDLALFEPDYFDFEHNTDPDFLANVSFKTILSYHNFQATPKHLELILNKMLLRSSYVYKVCTTANSFSDAYKMLRFVQKMHKAGVKIIGICMGDYGRITRTEGIKAGNYLNYTILHARDKVAPGLAFA